MNRAPSVCPGCDSPHTASRRQLFHQMMNGASFQGTFSWYDKSVRHAFPPKSLFIVLITLILAVTVPAIGFWFLEQYPALQWLGAMAGVLLACLLIDVMVTYRRYKSWVREWLCGDCQQVFVP